MGLLLTCRYGRGPSSVYLGEQMAGTLCSRSFRSCDQRTCRVQSPGYPGIYPRNVHCLYHISHRPTQPAGATSGANNQRSAIVLSQPDARKISLRDWNIRTDRPGRSSVECAETASDYIAIYDGPSTSSPVLARFCGGPLPDIVSSGPDMVVEFRTSVYDTVYSGWASIEGFELNVRVTTLPTGGPIAGSGPTPVAGPPDASKCHVDVLSSGLSRGWLVSSNQTWPMHTTCRFRFAGRNDERVWIYFLKYHFGTTPGVKSAKGRRPSLAEPCHNSLTLIDGNSSANETQAEVVRQFCRDRTPPPLCERHLSTMTASRNPTPDHGRSMPPPCLFGESFTSAGPVMSVVQHLPDGTAFHLWSYVLAYEFFRQSQDGQPLNASHPHACQRVFSSRREMRGSVRSPQNVFLFGRGGAHHLK